MKGAPFPSTIGATSNRLLRLDATAFGYDANGNTTTVAGTPRYHYDAFNRMDSAAGIHYDVNPEGQQLRKSGADGTSYFAPGQSGALLAEYAGGWIDYAWLNGRLIGRVAGGQIDAIHADQVGRPEVVTSASQAVIWRAQNFAFNQRVVAAGITLNLGFPGQYYDAETAAWNNGYRDYNSASGRYLESDPIGLGGGINTYAYAGSNPLSNADPLGLMCISDGIASVVGAIAGGAVTGALTGAANGEGNPWAILTGAVSGAAIGGGAQALSNSLSSNNPDANPSAASGFSNFIGSLIQDKGNGGVAITNGILSYTGTTVGSRGGVTSQMGGRLVTYVGAATVANRGLGVGAFVAGPMFGIAGAYTDMAAEAAAKSYSDCDCKR